MRLLYITGNGDAISSFKSWRAGEPDPSQVSVTFSSQVYAFAEAVGANLTVVGSHAVPGTHRDGAFLITQGPRRLKHWRGALFHLADLIHLFRLLAIAARRRCRHLVIDSGNAPMWAMAPLTLMGLRIVLVMHNTIWCGVAPPRGRKPRLMFALSRAAIRRCEAVLCVSHEVRRQVERLCPRARCVPVLPMFYREYFDLFEPAARHAGEPFRCFFAGRIERSKGVFDLLAAAEALERTRPGRFRWEVGGGGGALDELRAQCARRGLSDVVAILGPLDRCRMREAYERSHAVVVPTRTEFPEGFCMVAAEGVLARRPVVTSTVVPAHEHLGGACLLATPNDAASYAAQIDRLESDPALYRSLVEAGERVRAPFFDRDRGVTRGLGLAFGMTVKPRTERAAAEVVVRGRSMASVLASASTPPASPATAQKSPTPRAGSRPATSPSASR